MDKLTKKQAQKKANEKVKDIVKRRFNYSDDFLKKHGLNLLKREIFHARKEVFIRYSCSQGWQAYHRESGLIK